MVQEELVVPQHLSVQELKKLITEAINAATYHETLETYHAIYDHMDRGIETLDVIHGLDLEWVFERQPQFNRKTWQWKYYILTETIDGEAITIVVAVDSWRKEFVTVTRWRED